jgi:uncharacterized protein (DUF1778 family)
MREQSVEDERHDVKRERLEARTTTEIKALLQHAADLEGRSLSDFVVDSARQHAEDVIRRHEVMRLSARDSLIFAEAILNPQPPTSALRAAFARYREEVVER